MTSALRRVVIDIGWSFSSLVFTVGGRAGMSSSAVHYKWHARARRPRNGGQYSKTKGEASGNWERKGSIGPQMPAHKGGIAPLCARQVENTPRAQLAFFDLGQRQQRP